MDTKINITIYDILSYLFPGIALFIILKNIFKFSVFLNPNIDFTFIIIFGYLLGAALHQFGLILFYSVNSGKFKKNKFLFYLIIFLDYLVSIVPFKGPIIEQDEIKNELKKEIKENLNIDIKDNLMLFSLSDSISSCIKDSDKNILLSKEGLFRALTSLIFVITLLFIVFEKHNKNIFIFIFLIFLLELFRYSREYFRAIKNQRIYHLALLLIKKKLY